MRADCKKTIIEDIFECPNHLNWNLVVKGVIDNPMFGLNSNSFGLTKFPVAELYI